MIAKRGRRENRMFNLKTVFNYYFDSQNGHKEMSNGAPFDETFVH
jgi:hypothetical protein